MKRVRSVFLALIAKPLHWATFNMSYHAWDEPIVRTLRAAQAKRVTVITPRVGQKFELGQPFKNEHWWRGPNATGSRESFGPACSNGRIT